MSQPISPAAMTGWVTLGNDEQKELAGMGSRLGARHDMAAATVVVKS